MQLFSRGFRCLSTAPPKVKFINVYDWPLICFTGPPPQGGCGGRGGEEEEGKASTGGPPVRDCLHRPHAGDGVGRGWRLAGPKDCPSGPNGDPSWCHCTPVCTGAIKNSNKSKNKQKNLFFAVCLWGDEGSEGLRQQGLKTFFTLSSIK